MRLGKFAVAIAALMLALEAKPWALLSGQTRPPDAAQDSDGTPPGQKGVVDGVPELMHVETIPSPIPDQIVPEISATNPAASKPAAAAKKKSTARKSSNHSGPRRRVIKEGGTEESEIQLSEGMPSEVASHRRASTATLLSSTEETLKRLSGQTLTADQQATVNQIRLFMQQSRDASQQSDVDRAHTLAVKAHLLSDALMKP